MLRTTLLSSALVVGAALITLPAMASDDSYNRDTTYRNGDHAWYGDHDYSRCPSHRPLDVFRDGEGGFQAWRAPHRVCGWGTAPESQQRYGGGGTPHG